jgi:hypothetical protein
VINYGINTVFVLLRDLNCAILILLNIYKVLKVWIILNGCVLTCDEHLKKGKVPPSAISNGLKFPAKPDFFDLNELECRLIAPRFAFQKIMQAPRGRQLKITGNVVNVPADICNTVNEVTTRY